ARSYPGDAEATEAARVGARRPPSAGENAGAGWTEHASEASLKWLQRDVSLQPERGACPFGWSIACAGRKPAQVREEVRSLVDWAIATWATYFTSEHGYVLAGSSPSGPSISETLTTRCVTYLSI